jgi:hypothetical protein
VLKQTMSGTLCGEDEKKIGNCRSSQIYIGSILGFCCEDDGNTAADKKMLLFKKIRK